MSARMLALFLVIALATLASAFMDWSFLAAAGGMLVGVMAAPLFAPRSKPRHKHKVKT